MKLRQVNSTEIDEGKCHPKLNKTSTSGKAKSHQDSLTNKIRNFGTENCKMITDESVTKLEEKYGHSDEIYQLIMIDLLNLIHFNSDYPENRNLKFIPDSTDIGVYFHNKWQNLDHHLLIAEYFKGNLKRLHELRPDGKLVEKIKVSFANHQNDIITDFNYLIQLGEHSL